MLKGKLESGGKKDRGCSAENSGLARWKSPGRSGHPLLELVVLGTPRGVLHELLPHSMGLVVKHLRDIGNRAEEHGACGRLDLSPRCDPWSKSSSTGKREQVHQP